MPKQDGTPTNEEAKAMLREMLDQGKSPKEIAAELQEKGVDEIDLGPASR